MTLPELSIPLTMELDTSAEVKSVPEKSEESTTVAGTGVDVDIIKGKTEEERKNVSSNLLKNYKLNCEQAEAMALSYVSEELQHPVISCFRELTKVDINAIFGSVRLHFCFLYFVYSIYCQPMKQSYKYLTTHSDLFFNAFLFEN